MKIKNKKRIYRILKIVWFMIGGFILLWTIFFFIKMYSINTLGIIAVAVLFGIGLYLLLIFIFLTILFLLVKWAIKQIKHKKHK
ncbi:hypothetical protein KAR52_02625 [Candidatus Pacearchaeota archaeon]|nr:hypothetical protein [Candidatus Pacearchaeota archaeon]